MRQNREQLEIIHTECKQWQRIDLLPFCFHFHFSFPHTFPLGLHLYCQIKELHKNLLAKQPRSSRRCPQKPVSRDNRPRDGLTDLQGKRNALGLIQILVEAKGVIQKMKKAPELKRGLCLY